MIRTFLAHCWVVALLTLSSSQAAGQSPPVGGYDLQTIGLTGPTYDYVGPAPIGGIGRWGTALSMNLSGQVAGHSARYVSVGAIDLGSDAWVFDGSATHMISLTGQGYEYATGGQTYRASGSLHINASGSVLGSSARFASNGSSAGVDLWLRTGGATNLVGLTGAGYEFTSAGTISRSSQISHINPAGTYAGYSQRFSSSGLSLGRDAWMFNGSVTQLVGLTGGTYEWGAPGSRRRNGDVVQVNPTGQSIGLSERFTSSSASLGFDAWFFDGSTTQVIGLNGVDYSHTSSSGTTRLSTPSAMNSIGQSVGTNRRYSVTGGSLGSDSWFFDGSTSQMIGLVGANYEYAAATGTFRRTLGQKVNDAGHATGYSERYSSTGTKLGQDAWRSTVGMTQRVGLIGGDYEYASSAGVHRTSSAEKLNTSGQIAGHSLRYSSSGDDLGRDSWFFDGAISSLIGLEGGPYEYLATAGVIRSSITKALTNTGMAIGTNQRYSASGGAQGQAGWFFDAATLSSTALEFSFRNDGYAFTSPQLITESGVVLGYYNLYAGSALLGERAFWWSADEGFRDLGSLVTDGLSAEGWNWLATVYDDLTPGAIGEADGDSPLYVVGTGQTVGQSAGQSVFRLSAVVPEPTTLVLFALAPFVWRRRRQ